MPKLQQLTAEETADLPDNAVRTLTQLLVHVISITDNEVLTKDLEDLATLQFSHGVGVGSYANRSTTAAPDGLELGNGEGNEKRAKWVLTRILTR